MVKISPSRSYLSYTKVMERSLACERLKLAAVLVAAACVLSACGRAGSLEPPPGPAIGVSPTAQAAPPAAPASTVEGPVASGPTENQTAIKNGFDANGNPVAPPGQKKSFLLDPLLQ